VAKTRNDILFRYLADTKNLEKGNRRAKKSMGGVQDIAKRLGGVLAVTFGAREILRFGQDAITAAVDYTEAVNAIEVATGSASDQIIAMGEDSATALGISKTELLEAGVAFAGFADQIDSSAVGDTFGTLIDRASDFASVYNIEVKDALEVFQSTLAGQSKPIRAFGLDLSAASVQAFAVAEGIIEIDREMTEGEKVRARFALLMEETAVVQGDFANTSGEVAGQTRIATAELENMRIELGQKLIPIQRRWIELQRDAIGVAEDLIDATSDTAKENELLSRRMFQLAKDAGRVTGSYEDMVSGANEVIDQKSRWGGFWDFLIGRTEDLDDELLGLSKDYNIFNETFAASDDAMIGYASASKAAIEATEDLGDAATDAADKYADFRDKILGAISAAADAAAIAAINLEKTFTPGSEKPLSADFSNFATGGTVGGPRGKAQLAVVHGGERVTTPGNNGGGGGITINFNGVVGDPVAVAQEIQDLLDLNSRVNGPASGI